MDTRSVSVQGSSRSFAFSSIGAEFTSLLGEEQANNKAEQAKYRAEDLDDEDLDESVETHDKVSQRCYYSQ